MKGIMLVCYKHWIYKTFIKLSYIIEDQRVFYGLGVIYFLWKNLTYYKLCLYLIGREHF